MKIINSLQAWIDKRKPRTPEQIEYEQYLKVVDDDIARFEQYLDKANKDFLRVFTENREEYQKFAALEERLRKLRKLNDQETLNIVQNEMNEYLKNSQTARYISHCIDEVGRWKYQLYAAKLKKNFIRPNREEDIQERDRIANTFGKELMEIVGEDTTLRFHGTPVYFAKEIINSGVITSTADRFDGYIASTDLAGTFSASSIKSLDRSINFFTDFASFQRGLPCGVLFVLNEKAGDEELRKSDEMQSVNFRTNPEQLVGIVCTSEVYDMALNWCLDNGYATDKVFTYDSFLDYARNNNLNSGGRNR